MKCIFYDIRRAIAGRWFLAALLASAAALYLSVGQAADSLMNVLREWEFYADIGFQMDLADLLRRGLTGDFGVMTLPALSALPYAAQPLTELKCGALRPVIFRTGRSGWILGKAAACVLSGMALHAASALLLALFLQGLTLGMIGQPLPLGDAADLPMLLLRRMLCGGIWAGVGCVLALVTETTSAAYLAPLCLCYAMAMIGTRFFPEVLALNPIHWLTGLTWPLLLFVLAVAVWLMLELKREVAKHA